MFTLPYNTILYLYKGGVYNALNRPISYTRENEDGTRTVITNHRFLYRGYLQIGRRKLFSVKSLSLEQNTLAG